MKLIFGRMGHTGLIFALSGCFTAMPLSATAQDKIRRDVESYAIASCLVYQKEPYLKDQGDGWASVIVQRSKGDLDAFTSVAAAVKTEVAKGDMAIIRSETGAAQDKALPVAYCMELIDSPAIHAAVEKAIKSLAGSYKN